jgi:putative DNA primase/helicase
MSPRPTMARYAERYIDQFGVKLAPLWGKVPIGGEAWNADKNLICTPAAALEYWTRNPSHNIGVALIGRASLDADNEEWTRRVLASEGIEFDALIATTPTIFGRAPRLEFIAPPGVMLNRKALVFPRKAPGEKPVTVLELRTGRVQDVFPPSIHPDTLRPYRWLTPPRNGFPMLPDALLRLWLDFDAFKRRARAMCPWADPEPEPTIRQPRERTGPSVITAFNDAHDPVAILEASGYQRVAKRRWKSPNGSGMAGVVLLPSGKVFCHHQSDEGLGDGRAHDAFDVFRILEHGGDFRSAVKAAAVALGMDRGRA